MQAYQIFQKIPPELTVEILTAIREKDRAIYKTSIGSLASQKRLRPIFIQKKPLDQQMQWAHKTLQLKLCDELGEQLLQVWLLGCHSGVLVEFLDEVGIAHDGEGSVDDLPEELDAAKLRAGVDKLFAGHDPSLVTIYLHMFQLQRPGGWKELGELIETDERLSFGNSKSES